MNQITKITKEEAKITAKFYIASLFALADGFNTDNGYVKVQDEIDFQVSKLLKGLDYEKLPTSSLDCIKLAKEFVANKKAQK